jgi:hypothetical protein
MQEVAFGPRMNRNQVATSVLFNASGTLIYQSNVSWIFKLLDGQYRLYEDQTY